MSASFVEQPIDAGRVTSTRFYAEQRNSIFVPPTHVLDPARAFTLHVMTAETEFDIPVGSHTPGDEAFVPRGVAFGWTKYWDYAHPVAPVPGNRKARPSV